MEFIGELLCQLIRAATIKAQLDGQLPIEVDIPIEINTMYFTYNKNIRNIYQSEFLN